MCTLNRPGSDGDSCSRPLHLQVVTVYHICVGSLPDSEYDDANVIVFRGSWAENEVGGVELLYQILWAGASSYDFLKLILIGYRSHDYPSWPYSSGTSSIKCDGGTPSASASRLIVAVVTSAKGSRKSRRTVL